MRKCEANTKGYVKATHGAQGHYDSSLCGRPAKFLIRLPVGRRPGIWVHLPDGPIGLCGIHANYYGAPRPEITPNDETDEESA